MNYSVLQKSILFDIMSITTEEVSKQSQGCFKKPQQFKIKKSLTKQLKTNKRKVGSCIMAEKKITKKDRFEEIKGIIELYQGENKEELLSFLNNEIELLEKKSANRKPTEKQLEFQSLTEELKGILVKLGQPSTIKEIKSANEKFNEFSPQKISAMLLQLIKKDEVVRTEIKKTAYFSIK